MRCLNRSNLALVLGLAMLSIPVGASGQDLAGTWVMEISAPEGSHAFSLTLAVDGEAVTGTAGRDETFTGTFKEGIFEIIGVHYIEEAGMEAELWMSGTIADDAITGEAYIEDFPLQLAGKREN
jgi:hypothetical protein